ncbi:cysteine-rich CWC family protein [Vibrio hepatarius]|nr:cysteine-rich CWC family protein [Vibrio hepatarius]MBU2896227.1 cysteine-rich CWC family protein [Vibrio hepatarius]
MKTPCIAACKNTGGICNGCFRTIDEIVSWKNLSDSKRDNIIKTLSAHSSSHRCPSCNEPATCDISQGNQTCWCFSLEPRVIPLNLKNNACLCRQCLSKLDLA